MSSLPPFPSPAYLRPELVQTVAQSIPAIMAGVPQVQPSSLPREALAGVTSTPMRDAPPVGSVLSPLAPVSVAVAALLAAETEARLRSVVRSALQFMRHAHRQVLSTDDINRALKHMNAPAVYGSDNRQRTRQRDASESKRASSGSIADAH